MENVLIDLPSFDSLPAVEGPVLFLYRYGVINESNPTNIEYNSSVSSIIGEDAGRCWASEPTPATVKCGYSAFPVIGEEIGGYWIDVGSYNKAWVPKNRLFTFAYPTKERALLSYVSEKQIHYARCLRQLGVTSKELSAIREEILSIVRIYG